MMRRSVPLLAALVCYGCQPITAPTTGGASTPPTTAREEKIVEDVKALVATIANATADGEYDVVIDLTHPKVLEAAGGKEVALRQVQLGMDFTRKQGFTFRVAGIGQPVVARGGDAHYAVVPYTMALSAPGKKGTSKTSVVGISSDGGNTWKFAQVSARDGEDGIRRMFPDFPRDLRIPRTERALDAK